MIFNFDEWATLYKADPALFEQRRRDLIASTIAQAPAEQQLRLHQLQWKIDAIRQTNTPPGCFDQDSEHDVGAIPQYERSIAGAGQRNNPSAKAHFDPGQVVS